MVADGGGDAIGPHLSSIDAVNGGDGAAEQGGASSKLAQELVGLRWRTSPATAVRSAARRRRCAVAAATEKEEE